MIEARGAPYAQGRDQGEALAPVVRTALAFARTELGRIAWWRALRRARRGPGRAVLRFLPQHHERLSGIADGARVAICGVELLDAGVRVQGSVGARSGGLEARVDLPSSMAEGLVLRRSVPDAGGFPSLELTCAPWPGCLAGVNTEGIAVVCGRDLDVDAPSVRILAQEILLRMRRLEAAVDHLRRRVAYVGGLWSLALADGSGRALRVEQRASGLNVTEDLPLAFEGPGLQIVVRPSQGGLRVEGWVRPLEESL